MATENLDTYRVKIAAEVDLGHDQIVGGVEVSVEALTPQLAIIMALQAAMIPMLEELGVDQQELMRQMGLHMRNQFTHLMSLFGMEGEEEEEAPESLPIALPQCKCGHGYNSHHVVKGLGTGGCNECHCEKYELPE